MNAVLITGYKMHELGVFNESHEGIKWIKFVLKKRMIALIEEGATWFITSGQLGVEQWAMDVVDELKEIYPHIQLGLLTPFEEQESKWNERLKELYHERVSKADFVDSISKRPYENPMQLKVKNDFLVQKTDGLLVLFDEEKEGSPLFYIKVARSMDKPIFIISPEEIEEARREALDDF
ncbi:DUF1273 domain-containing protein [Shouchella lehensis]|uniref:Uncharacterized protein n=1 Tax=Shouchella lehensis G1 TaxID=1246626 RepID=A0A060M1V9_9BACI|nr:DUF1273 domain-containing protein [Shouchella lehensis]AIC94528.1 hypothetical protein BleG1_1950 [Shouchella lehensis G1]